MPEGYILYNPHAGGHTSREDLTVLELVLDRDLTAVDMTELADYGPFFAKLQPEDLLILAGGDGTLNRFVNDTDGLTVPCEIYYYPTGNGNDFARDMGRGANPFPVAAQLRQLPTVEVKGRSYRFLNGVGFGIDGYCCEMGDELRKDPDRKVNYTAIAIRGLLMDYIPTAATVTVDGQRHEYKKVWIAPTMLGRYYGGGMMPTPRQDRHSGQLSAMVFHDCGKLRALTVFPSIFRGEHIKYRKYVDIFTGSRITVEFDQPRPLQIDGETVLNVRSYTAQI